MKTETLESETFGSAGRSYFIDFKKARNNSDYIRITRTDRMADETYKRASVVIFEQDFFFLIESFSMLFSKVSHRKAQKQKAVNSGDSAVTVAAKGIKSWEPELRPREKLMAGGKDSLSSAELLALVIGSGTSGATAVDLASQVFALAGGKRSRLNELCVEDLVELKGLGDTRAVAIIAALELGRRLNTAPSIIKLNHLDSKVADHGR